MGKYLFIFLALGMFQCTTNSTAKPTSKWQALADADTTECEAWPLNKNTDIGINELRVIRGSSINYLATGKSRAGVPTAYRALVGEQNLITQLEATSLGPDSLIIGGGIAPEDPNSLILVKTTPEQKSILQVRSLKTNVVLRESKPLPERIASGSSFFSKEGIWVLYKSGPQDLSIEDLPYRAMFIPWPSQKGEKLNPKIFKSVDLPFSAIMVPSATGALLVWLETKGEQSQFKGRILEPSGSALAENQINLPITQGVESWRIGQNKNNYYLSLVDGDSLVGQASLKVAKFTWGEIVPNVDWVKTKSLLNEHVSDHHWVFRGPVLSLLMPKWLDEEVTLATYRVGGSSVESQVNTGIFPKGTSLVDAFAHPNGKETIAILKTRAQFGWDYRLCHLPN